MVFLAENREKLRIEYTQMNEFGFFINSIKRMAPEYAYVCAKERRCFNIVARFLPQVNMISSRALMLKYAEIAEYYRDNGRFPRILILDDLMIHGRGVAKVLQQLEDMLVIKLLDMGVLKRSDSYRYTVYKELTEAITVFVYARSIGVLFLEPNYTEKLLAVKKLYADEMRDLSLQLSIRMAQWDIANTSYVYSVRSDLITEHLLDQKDGRIGTSEWVRRKWNYGGEEMILYARLHGNKKVNRIDTMRFFPGRCSEEGWGKDPLPLLTSFSFFGDLRETTMRKLIKEVYQILQKAELYHLADILKEDSNEQINIVLMQTQIQLISFFLSVAMLMDFCIDIIPQDKLDDIAMRGDIWKISRNFGKHDEICPELMQIRRKALRNKLKDTILRVIDEEAEELIQISPSVALEQLGNDSKATMAVVNGELSKAIYHIEMNSERKAYELSARPYRFVPKEYQERCGQDGVISLRDLAQKKHFGAGGANIFSYLAAFVAMMDSSAVSVRTKAIRGGNGEIRVSTLAKAGEKSAFYLPAKLAMFVPVFAFLEENTFNTPSTQKRTLRRYLEKLVNVYFSHDCSKLCRVLENKKQVIAVKEAACDALGLTKHGETVEVDPQILEEIDRLYDSGHSFYGWNFGNLTAMRHLNADEREGIEKFRKHLIDEIEEMYSFTLPLKD